MLQISADLLSMSSDAALLVKNGKLAFANAAALELLGSDCVGKTVQSVLGAEFSSTQGDSFIGELIIDGARHTVRKKSSEGISAIFLNKVEYSDRMLNDAFIFALRSCLMNIDVALNLLRLRLEEQPELSESVAVISHDSFKLNRVLTNVSILSSMGRKEGLVSTEHIDLSHFIGQLVDSISLLVRRPEIKFSAPAELKIWVDPSMLESLMLNLISNCLCHAEGCKRISINLTKTKRGCMISVDDDGCGIDIDDIQKSFSRYKYDFDVEQVDKGPGLGISVARAIAYLHGGTLLMESRAGRGTAVRVSLCSTVCKDKANQKMPFQSGMKNLLVGLAHCLPSEFYTEKYTD